MCFTGGKKVQPVAILDIEGGEGRRVVREMAVQRIPVHRPARGGASGKGSLEKSLYGHPRAVFVGASGLKWAYAHGTGHIEESVGVHPRDEGDA